MSRRLAATTLAAALLTIGLTGCEESYNSMSCTELTNAMLDMTGPAPTEEYDLDKVWEINEARKGRCPGYDWEERR